MRLGVLGLVACGLPRVDAAIPADCGACHPIPSRQHAVSRHAQSDSAPAYVRALAEASMPSWCEGCHAPEPWGHVACGACHPPSAAKDPRHPQHPAAEDRVTGERCAACHQFGVPPDHPEGATDLLIQTTWDEWQASPAAAAGQHCSDCHDHRAAGARHRRWVRRALRVDVRRVDGDVNVTLTAHGVGHRLPTGDLTRALQIVSRAPDGKVLGRRRLGRQIGGEPVRVLRDTRLEPDVPVTVVLPAGEVAVWLDLVAPAHVVDLEPGEVRTTICDPCRESR